VNKAPRSPGRFFWPCTAQFAAPTIKAEPAAGGGTSSIVAAEPAFYAFCRNSNLCGVQPAMMAAIIMHRAYPYINKHPHNA
jgi:hypothetical protein